MIQKCDKLVSFHLYVETQPSMYFPKFLEIKSAFFGEETYYWLILYWFHFSVCVCIFTYPPFQNMWPILCLYVVCPFSYNVLLPLFWTLHFCLDGFCYIAKAIKLLTVHWNKLSECKLHHIGQEINGKKISLEWKKLLYVDKM